MLLICDRIVVHFGIAEFETTRKGRRYTTIHNTTKHNTTEFDLNCKRIVLYEKNKGCIVTGKEKLKL